MEPPASDSLAHQPLDPSTRLSLPQIAPKIDPPSIGEEAGADDEYTAPKEELSLHPAAGDFPSDTSVDDDDPELPLPPLELEMPSWARQSSPRRPDRTAWWLILGGVVLTAAAFAAGYFGHDFLAGTDSALAKTAPALPSKGGRTPSAGERLTPATQAALDAAFGAMTDGKPQDARAQFAALLKKHPGWPQLALSQARAAFYQGDGIGAKHLLDSAQGAGQIDPADEELMNALLRMSAGDLPMANESFELAASWDPTRDDIYYLWGECLRRLGKPVEAAAKFRSAMLRNQREPMEAYYRFKLWLAEIQGNLDAESGAGAEIEAKIAQPHPAGYALAAGAARAMRDKNYSLAADLLHRASQALEPSAFHMVIGDALFVDAAYRPEFSEFFAPKPAPVAH